jgi:hypothetical protein
MSEFSYEEIRQRVEKRYKERQDLIIHFAVFVLSNLVIWGLWFLFLAGPFPWPLIVTLGWSVGIVSHFLTYYFKYGAGANRREDAIERDVEQEMARRVIYEKPKNDEHVRLTEDGELEEVSDDEISQAGKRNRR